MIAFTKYYSWSKKPYSYLRLTLLSEEELESGLESELESELLDIESKSERSSNSLFKSVRGSGNVSLVRGHDHIETSRRVNEQCVS